MDKKSIEKYVIIFLGVLVLLLIIVVCMHLIKNKKNDNNPTIVLNERQKEILISQGLPIDYEELNYTQKESIIAIEELLTFVENKYGIEFCYDGYIPRRNLEEETLYAYPKGEDTKRITVIRTTNDNITDNYINILLEEPVQNMILEYISDKINSNDVKVYLEVTDTNINTTENLINNIKGNVGINAIIFVDEDIVSTAMYLEILENFKTWLKEEQLDGLYQLIRLKENKLKYLTQYNYSDYLSDEHYIEREDFYIK